MHHLTQDNLRTHLKKHSGEKSHKCNQCVYACVDSGSLMKHKDIVEKSQINAVIVTVSFMKYALLKFI